MTPDDPLLKQLIDLFNVELEALLAVIQDNLQKIKENPSGNNLNHLMEEISRSGRNIKVSAFSIGADTLGKIAECIEKLFAPAHQPSLEAISLTDDAVDGMREAMRDFEKNAPSAHLDNLLSQLQQQTMLAKKQEETQIPEQKPASSENITPPATPATTAVDQDFLKKIVETFKTELQENLIIITDSLLQLEKGVKSAQEFQNLLAEMFRVAHNIKGSARGVGADHVSEIAHHLETLFTLMQKKNINISAELINLCLQSIDYMNEAMHSYSEGLPLSFDLQKHLMQLQSYAQPLAKLVAAPDDERHKLEVSLPVSEDLSTVVTEQSSPTVAPDKKPEQALPSVETSLPAELQTKTNEFESIRVSLQNLDRISAYMEELQRIKIAIEEHYSNLNKINFKIEHALQLWKKNLSGNENLHVNTFFSTVLSELAAIGEATHLLQRELRIPMSELSVLNALQDEIGTVRLIPVASQLHYLPRIVRDLANKLKKRINFEIKSNDVKIDKMILDGLKDPIIHLLRNAIDHGIENAEIREAAGKSPEGTITIDVTQEDNQIVFQISDDGAGINTDDLLHIALQKNLITQNQLETIRPEDIYELIFLPGFSTREVATDISGRGVGLDVVRSNLAHLKGQVHLESQLGSGTHFFLRVPLTLATEHGLILACCGQVFVISTSTVDNVLLLENQDIITVEGIPTVLINEQPVLLCSLSKVLHLDENPMHPMHRKEQFSVVVLRKDEERIALLVDEIIGEREILLKPLQEPLVNIPCVIGATLTGSNQINFVLNSEEIIKKTLL